MILIWFWYGWFYGFGVCPFFWYDFVMVLGRCLLSRLVHFALGLVQWWRVWRGLTNQWNHSGLLRFQPFWISKQVMECYRPTVSTLTKATLRFAILGVRPKRNKGFECCCAVSLGLLAARFAADWVSRFKVLADSSSQVWCKLSLGFKVLGFRV